MQGSHFKPGDAMRHDKPLGILQRTGPRPVASLFGFEVHEAFPRHLEYREGDYVLRFAADPARPGTGAAITLYDGIATDRWEPPHDTEPIGDVKKHQILVRVTAALALLGITPAWETFAPGGPRKDWPEIEAEAAALLRRAK